MLRLSWFLVLLTCSSFTYGQISSIFPPYDDTTQIKTLAHSITDTIKGDSAKAVALYDWVITNIRYDSDQYKVELDQRKFFKDFDSLDPVSRAIPRDPFQYCSTVLKTHKALCRGYSYLFLSLCKAINIYGELVVGHGKSDLHKQRGDIGHMWVIIQLGSNWYLTDPTWDASLLTNHVQGTALLKFFGLSPTAFAETHQPLDPTFQLLEHPVTANSFWANQKTEYSAQSVDFKGFLLSEKSLSDYEKMLKRVPRMYNFDSKNPRNKSLMLWYYCELGRQNAELYDQKNRYINSSTNIDIMANRAIPLKIELAKLLRNFQSSFDKITPLLDELDWPIEIKRKVLNEFTNALHYINTEQESLKQLFVELEAHQQKRHRRIGKQQ
jgi:hypothetical protein